MDYLDAKIDELARLLIRPRRNSYQSECLGPSHFRIAGQSYTRTDMAIPFALLPRSPQASISCSIFKRQKDPVSRCVLAMHGNTGNRLMACEMLGSVLEGGFSFACFDFVGCGNSGQSPISLGYWEKHQIQQVMVHLNRQHQMNEFLLAGRSMGAAAALMLMQEVYGPTPTMELPHCSIGGLILDSPYFDLRKLVCDIAADKLPFLPAFMRDWAIQTVETRVGQELMDCKDFSLLEETRLRQSLQLPFPVIILYGLLDSVVSKEHIAGLFGLLQSRRRLHLLEGQTHDEIRAREVYQSCLSWIWPTRD